MRGPVDRDSTAASQQLLKDSAGHGKNSQSLGPSGEALGKANASARNWADGIPAGWHGKGSAKWGKNERKQEYDLMGNV